jgi:PKD repeat protein
VAKGNRYERWWSAGLIALGVVALGVAFIAAFAIVRDPGTYYDEWVPVDGPDGPEASFEWVASGRAVEFLDTSTMGDANLEQRVWDFGDGTESTDSDPSHRYATDGEYTVRLDVMDANGLTSQAEGAVSVEVGADTSGEGAIGMNDLAADLTDTVERAAKGGGVVLLVIGMLVVLTMIGGRLVRQGVRTLRPIPDRISMKLRPKELELAVAEPADSAVSPTDEVVPPPPPARETAPSDADARVRSGV